ncbi:MAG TPA: hypothetical protein VIL95_00975 [Bacillota bacterium]
MDDQALAKVMATTDGGAERDFRNLSRHEQRRLLVSFIERGQSDEEIGQRIGMSQWQVRNLRYRLGIKKDRGGNVYLETTDRQPGRTPSAVVATNAPQGPFSLVLRGVFRGDQLARRLDGLRALFDNGDPHRQYNVQIELSEAPTAEVASPLMMGENR